MSLSLYNTYTRNKEDFKPIHDGEVGLYTCGLTVYNYAHIGNLRTYIFEDILKRTLEYNGYKVYWSDGAQIVPPHDRNIISEVRKITSIEQVKRLPRPEAEKQGLLEIIGDSIDDAYLEAIKKISITPHQDRAYGGEIKIIYTPLHGTGIKLVPRALAEWGFSNVMVCAEQAQPDGNFPNHFPDPAFSSAASWQKTAARPDVPDISAEQAESSVLLHRTAGNRSDEYRKEAKNPQDEKAGIGRPAEQRLPRGVSCKLKKNTVCASYPFTRLKKRNGRCERSGRCGIIQLSFIAP